MSLLNYFKRKKDLPNPRGSLSSSISPRAIALANREVQEEIKRGKENKPGPYNKLVVCLTTSILEAIDLISLQWPCILTPCLRVTMLLFI